ncbi:hypothetical protein [Mycolicibacterium austroafricanum]|uniref:hypothetical protein n=1 Tax=Mycolicibacterium austroafricanum TaxID=39687 RepID=UPI000CF95053|nr:hypothetical protein [Mycolicibacterium austroafricanum]PQP41044.1 hypothetical protein C6A88_29480 [Mycolicibacterium austroafricanum]
MELTWWPVAAVGVGALILAIAVAVLLPKPGDDGLPLANTARLTALPEYRAVVRRRTRAAVVALTLSVLLFTTVVVATARPSGTFWDTDASEPRDDIMLCVGAPAGDEATSRFLGYFARQATTYGSERIGLTSANRRLVPLTRDYQFAAGRLAEFSRGDPAVPQLTAPVKYDDYAPTVADVLALCLTGFPGFREPGDTRRSLIYLGPGTLRTPGDDRPSLFTDAQVTEMARHAGVQINAVATAGRDTGALSTATEATGGRFFRFDAAEVDGQLDAIRAEPPAGPSQGLDTRKDSPVVVLVAALALAALLGVALPAVRR